MKTLLFILLCATALAEPAIAMQGRVAVVTGLDPSRRYAVQASEDLRGWQTLREIAASGDQCFYLDGLRNGRCFYRLLTLALPRPARPPQPRGDGNL